MTMRRQPARVRPWHLRDLLPPDAIATLDVPPIMPGDIGQLGPDVWVSSGESTAGLQLFYDMYGRPLRGSLVDCALMAEELFLRHPMGHVVSGTFYRAGIPIQVSTAYVGINMSLGFGPPVVWETMIFVQGQGTDLWRYTTLAAAHHGHAQIVDAIRRQQRAHRRRQVMVAPRRPA